MKNSYNRYVAPVFASGLTLASMSSQAAMDTAGVTSALTDAGAAVAVIGAAVLLVVVGIKVFKWVARAL